MYLIPFIVPDNFTIKGEVDIVVNIIEPTTNITLHVYDMTIHEDRVKITFGGNTDIPVVGHGYDELRQFYVVHFEEELVRTTARLHIEWTGNLNDELAGFYRSSYTAEDGSKKYIATTQVHTPSVLTLYSLVSIDYLCRL